MANPITQTTKVQGNGSQTARMSKRELNDEVTKHFNAIKKARAEWSEDHDNVKADNAIGKALDEMQRLLPLGISEKQYTTVWNMARDYYTKARGLSDVPPVGSLLGAHYDEQLAKATEPLSEPFLTPEQIQTMKNLTEEIKDRDIEYFDDDFDVDNAVKTLKAIAASISYAHSSLVKGAKVEARSQIEKAKESLRAIMHQPANWSFWAPQINENLISATMAIELSLTGDTTPLSSLIELALSNDSQVLKDMVYTLLNKHIRLLGAPQNKRDEVALLKMKFEEARNSRPQPQPQEPTPAKEEQPISVPSTSQPQDEEDDDELPF